jgi:hypothetical protein
MIREGFRSIPNCSGEIQLVFEPLRKSRRTPPPREKNMIRFITVSACALILAGCTSETVEEVTPATNGAATGPAADASATVEKFELGKKI